MLRFLADENFNNDILRGLLRRQPDLDVVRVQDIGLSGAADPTLLGWAAQQGRIILTHDVTTMTRYAYERVQAGQCPACLRSAAPFQSTQSLKRVHSLFFRRHLPGFL
jgi:predicted nuclease of predicted toxin-antitoxin system